MSDRGPCWEVKESSLVNTNLRMLVIIYGYQSTTIVETCLSVFGPSSRGFFAP